MMIEAIIHRIPRHRRRKIRWALILIPGLILPERCSGARDAGRITNPRRFVCANDDVYEV
jgi:hypothetical protein